MNIEDLLERIEQTLINNNLPRTSVLSQIAQVLCVREQTEQLKRIADALETLANKEVQS